MRHPLLAKNSPTRLCRRNSFAFVNSSDALLNGLRFCHGPPISLEPTTEPRWCTLRNMHGALLEAKLIALGTDLKPASVGH
jgi:hypothetical protein